LAKVRSTVIYHKAHLEISDIFLCGSYGSLFKCAVAFFLLSKRYRGIYTIYEYCLRLLPKPEMM